VPFTEFDAENKFGRFDELLSVFHAEIGKSWLNCTLSHHYGSALGYPWVIYACSDVINDHERVCREHAYGAYNTVIQ
jgi:hypothetical protein